MFEENNSGKKKLCKRLLFPECGSAGREGCRFFKVLRIHSQSFTFVTLTWLKHLVSNLVLK